MGNVRIRNLIKSEQLEHPDCWRPRMCVAPGVNEPLWMAQAVTQSRGSLGIVQCRWCGASSKKKSVTMAFILRFSRSTFLAPQKQFALRIQTKANLPPPSASSCGTSCGDTGFFPHLCTDSFSNSYKQGMLDLTSRYFAVLGVPGLCCQRRPCWCL